MLPPASEADADRAVGLAWDALVVSRNTNVSLDDSITVIVNHWTDPLECVPPPLGYGIDQGVCMLPYSLPKKFSCRMWVPWRGSMCASAATLAHETLHCKQKLAGYEDEKHRITEDWQSVEMARQAICEAFP